MNRIKQLREQHHLTLRELSEKVGISHNAINLYEKGIRSPQLEMWQKLADYFNVPVPYLQGKSDLKHTGYEDVFRSAQNQNKNVIMATSYKLPQTVNPKDFKINDDLESIIDLSSVRVFNSEGLDITDNKNTEEDERKELKSSLPDYKRLLEVVANDAAKGNKQSKNIYTAIINLLNIYKK